MRSISSKAALRCTCEKVQRAAIESVADVADSVVTANEYVESFDGHGTAILRCHIWLLAFQYQPAIHHLGTHLRGMPGLWQAIPIFAPHNNRATPFYIVQTLARIKRIDPENPGQMKTKNDNNPPANLASVDLYCASNCPTSVEIAPSAMNTMLKPRMNTTESSITLRSDWDS